MKQSNFSQPPVAKIKTKILENFGTKRRDDYFWLNEKENQEVLDYLNKENEYTKMLMQPTKNLQKSIYDEIVGRIKEDDESYPYFYNGYYYYSRTIKDKQYGELCRKKKSIDAKEEIYFDINKMADSHKAFIFADYEISPDNKLAAYLYNKTGSYAEFTLEIKNLETGENLDFRVEGVSSVTWANDSQTLFYSLIDKTLRPTKVYRHRIGDAAHTLVYEETDEKFSCYVFSDKINKFIYINSGSSMTSEEKFISADNPEGEFKIFMPRLHRTEYSIIPHLNSFFVRYKDDDNLNGKLYKAPYETYEDKSTWTEVIAHDDKIALSRISVFKDYLITTTRKNGLKNINILHLNDEAKCPADYKIESIDFPEEIYDVGLGTNLIFDTKKIRYGYNSMKRPSTLFEYNIETKKTETLKVQEIPSGFDPDKYKVERLFATAKDGTKVPVALLYKADLKLDGTAPCLLNGYGSYGVNSNAGFSTSIFSLVDRGYVYAIAQIRGGSEMGEKWYEDGKLLNKKNSFTDFIDCAEHLINNKYTTNTKLSIMGGSAGGLLMGAVTNMRPELFHNVLAIVPFVDVVTSMLDDSLPLTTGEYEEWGNPNEKEYFEYMLSYSPYDNIEAKNYPNILVTGGLNDSQVLYHEPAKYTAKLRKLKTDDNIVLLHMNMESGHGGATGKYNRIKDVAFYYAFILNF